MPTWFVECKLGHSLGYLDDALGWTQRTDHAALFFNKDAAAYQIGLAKLNQTFATDFRLVDADDLFTPPYEDLPSLDCSTN